MIVVEAEVASNVDLNHSIIQLLNQSLTQSLNHLINHSLNESMNEWINQSIHLSHHDCLKLSQLSCKSCIPFSTLEEVKNFSQWYSVLSHTKNSQSPQRAVPYKQWGQNQASRLPRSCQAGGPELWSLNRCWSSHAQGSQSRIIRR